MEKDKKKSNFEVKTRSGMRLDECASWLQKTLRRGQEQDALWIAEELFQSGFQRYLLYRLWIIAFEDIGPANPQLVQLATSTYQAWLLHKKERKEFTHSGENRVFNGLLVCLIARSPKCRMSDDATQVILAKKNQSWKPDMNELAVLDEHVARGKEMKRKYRHWVEIGSKCGNLVGEEVIGGPTYKSDAETMWLEMADKNEEPPLPIDAEIDTLGLK